MTSLSTLEIKVSYRCSRRCAFCLFKEFIRLPPLSLAEAIDNVAFFRKHHQIEEVVVSGGEPTEWGGFTSFLPRIKDLGVQRIYLHSNAGPRLIKNVTAYASYLDRVMISYHQIGGHWSCTDECIVKLCHLGIRVRTNTLILNNNIYRIPTIMQHLMALGLKHLLITFPFPLGGTNEHLSECVIGRPAELKELIEESVKRAKENGVTLRFQGFPRCFLSPYEAHQDDWNERYLVDRLHQFDPDFRVFDGLLGRRYHRVCDRCCERRSCNGGWPTSWHDDVFPPVPFCVPGKSS